MASFEPRHAPARRGLESLLENAARTTIRTVVPFITVKSNF